MGKKTLAGKSGGAGSPADDPALSDQLKTLEAQINGLFEESSFGSFLTDGEGRCVGINQQALQWIGCSREEILDKLAPVDILANRNWLKLRACNDYVIAHHLTDHDLDLVDTHGHLRNFKLFNQDLSEHNHPSPFRRAIFFDISASKRARERQRIAAIAFESKMGICITDQNENVLEVNEAFSKITGHAASTLRGKKYDVFFADHVKADTHAAIFRAIQQKGFWEGEVSGRKIDSSNFVVWMNISAVPMLEKTYHYHVVCLYDITKSKVTQDEIYHLAYVDALTQLPNRRKLNDRLQRILSVIPRSHLHGAVLYIDLDNFKSINDTKGHATGDLLLIEVGRRLQKAVREGDMVARVGGDEFVVILSDLSGNIDEASYQANLIGTKIQEVLAIPFKFEDFVFNCGGSIGISIFGHGDKADDVFQQADMAMYQAKREGRNALCFFDPAMKKSAADYLQLEQALGKALESGQLELFYQPQFNYQGEILAVEALLRWRHPQRGLVLPDEFIAMAEDSGLILPIGLWVLETACAQINHWQSDPFLSGLQIAINVSSRQFRDPNFVTNVARILEASGANASRLKIELTESTMHDLDDMRFKMEEIRQTGIAFSLDDFGTGYSSLASLIKLPLAQLKIDRSFVNHMLANKGDTIVVKTIISMAKNLDMQVIAEGLETEDEKNFLNSLGCSLYQGFLLSPALPGKQVEELIKGINAHDQHAHLQV